LLGFHQFVEAFVWWGLKGHVDAGIGRIAMWVYLSIAFVVLPIFIPCALPALEPTARRRLPIAPFVAIGFAVAGILLAAMIHVPVGVRLRPYHLAYSLHLGHAAIVISLNVIAVCGA
jgi:hypothetical protein